MTRAKPLFDPSFMSLVGVFIGGMPRLMDTEPMREVGVEPHARQRLQVVAGRCSREGGATAVRLVGDVELIGFRKIRSCFEYAAIVFKRENIAPAMAVDKEWFGRCRLFKTALERLDVLVRCPPLGVYLSDQLQPMVLDLLLQLLAAFRLRGQVDFDGIEAVGFGAVEKCLQGIVPHLPF